MLILLALSGIFIEVTLLLVVKFAALREQIVGVIALQLLSSVFYLIAVFLILRKTQSRSFPESFTWYILAASLLFRITLWPLCPVLSEDAYRYRWEGQLQANGGNPYRIAPNDPSWAYLRDSAFPRVAAPGAKAGYGPMTEAIEWLTYTIVNRVTQDPFRQVFWFKLPGALFDLALLAALLYLVQVRGLPKERLLIYAWCPLPLFEFWATGHNDSIALFFLITAVAFALKNRPNWAVVALGLAAAAKIWPAILLPLFLRSGRPMALLQRAPLFAAGFALFTLPYATDIRENAAFMSGFLGGWRNNDFLFGLFRKAEGDPYRAKYTAFGVLLFVIVWVTWRSPRFERGILTLVVSMLAISANVHPWYLTWILPFLVFYPAVPLLLLIALMPLTYAVLIDWYALGLWNGSTAIRWYVYLPVVIYTVASTYLKRRNQSAADVARNSSVAHSVEFPSTSKS